MPLQLLSLLFLLLIPGPLHAQGTLPWDMKLPFAEATITYEIKGMEQGKELVYIKDYGRKTATYHDTVMTMMGMRQESKTVEIEDPDWVYTYDLKEKTGTKITNPIKVMRAEYQKLSAAEQQQVQKNAEKMGMNVMEGMAATVEQNAATLHGFSCDKTTVMGNTVYSIHKTGLALKTESDMMGMKMSIVATDIKQAAVPDSHFAHPPGITATLDSEADAMSASMAQQAITWLKDPQAVEKAKSAAPAPGAPAGGAQDQQQMMQQIEQLMQQMQKNQPAK